MNPGIWSTAPRRCSNRFSNSCSYPFVISTLLAATIIVPSHSQQHTFVGSDGHHHNYLNEDRQRTPSESRRRTTSPSIKQLSSSIRRRFSSGLKKLASNAFRASV